MKMWATIPKLLELIRFSHTLFALPFAIVSALLAWQTVPIRFRDAIGIVACMVAARSFAMAFNRLVDRHIDARNPRTAARHLPAGSLSVATVALFTILMAALFVAGTAIFLLQEPANSWPLMLSGPVLLFLGGYSLAKRFTRFAHVWLGAALSLAPLAAWIAIRGPLDLLTPGILAMAVLAWVTGFDILYACQDAAFDQAAGLYSIPARVGVPRALRIAAIAHMMMILFLAMWWWVTPQLHAATLVGLVAVAGLLIYEHALVRPDDLSRVNRAFFHVNVVISLGMLAVVSIDLLTG
jgi:4-hydroxybenzoate polyprenyltransferase